MSVERLSSGVSEGVDRAAIQQGYRVAYREAHTLLEELPERTAHDGLPISSPQMALCEGTA